MFGKLLKVVTSLPLRLVNVPLKIVDAGLKHAEIGDGELLSKPLDVTADEVDKAIDKTTKDECSNP